MASFKVSASHLWRARHGQALAGDPHQAGASSLRPPVRRRARRGDLHRRADKEILKEASATSPAHVEVGRDPYDARHLHADDAIVDETKEKAWAKHDELERYAST